ncbi:hypothetical protein [Kitasatospora sp. NPDC004272]
MTDLAEVEELEELQAPGFWSTVGGFAVGTVVVGGGIVGGIAIGVAIT